MLDDGFVDTWRKRNPDTIEFTYWGVRTRARASNKGWRLDYFIADEATDARVESVVHQRCIGGSDHCPIVCSIRVD